MSQPRQLAIKTLGFAFLLVDFGDGRADTALARRRRTPTGVGPEYSPTPIGRLSFSPAEIQSWKDNQIEERAAVGVENAGAAAPVYGVIWFRARTEVDKSSRLVTLEELKVTRADFPSVPDQASSLEATIQQKGVPLCGRCRSIGYKQVLPSCTRTQEAARSRRKAGPAQERRAEKFSTARIPPFFF